MNFAIIGAGTVAKAHEAAIRNISNAKLCAVADVNKEAAKVLAERNNCEYFDDAQKMLNEVKLDAVIICVPSFLHEEYIELCAKYNVNILCEKPLSTSSDSTTRIFDHIKETDIVFMVAQVVRFWPGYTYIKDIIESGELGSVTMYFASRCAGNEINENSWLFDPQKGAGAILDFHVHDVDYLRYVCGSIDDVYCLAKKDGTGCYNHAVSSFSLKSGAKAVVEADFINQVNYPFNTQVRIETEKATIEYTYRSDMRDTEYNKIRIYRKSEALQTVDIESYDAYTKQLEHFIACIDKKRQSVIVPHDENIEVMKTMDAIRRSADTGEVIGIS